MTTPSHLFGGYLVLSLTRQWWQVADERMMQWLWVIGLGLSVLIDLDVLWSPQGVTSHHKELPHLPLFWVGIIAVIWLIGYWQQSEPIRSLSVVVGVAALTHIALDLYGLTIGVHLLWPFSMQEFSLTPLRKDIMSNAGRVSYILSNPWVMWGEVLVIGASIARMVEVWRR